MWQAKSNTKFCLKRICYILLVQKISTSTALTKSKLLWFLQHNSTTGWIPLLAPYQLYHSTEGITNSNTHNIQQWASNAVYWGSYTLTDQYSHCGYIYLLVTHCIREEGNVIGSVHMSVCLVHPSIRFYSIFWTEWPMTLTFCMYMSHDRRSHGIKGQGSRMRPVQPRARAVLVYTCLLITPMPCCCAQYQHTHHQTW